MSARVAVRPEVEFRVGLGSCGIANGARPVRDALEAADSDAEALVEFGKAYKLQPYPALLFNIARCHEVLADLRGAVVPKARILAIGDGIMTDILGAMGEDIDSLFITGGLARAETGTTDQPNPEKLVYGPLTLGDSGVICFSEGSLIDTPEGPRAVETLKPGDLVRPAVTSGKYKNGELPPFLAPHAQHREPVNLRKTEVENDSIIILGRTEEMAVFAIGRQIDRIAVLFQSGFQLLAECWFVLDNQNAHAC